jgi:hypothetical protein
MAREPEAEAGGNGSGPFIFRRGPKEGTALHRETK